MNRIMSHNLTARRRYAESVLNTRGVTDMSKKLATDVTELIDEAERYRQHLIVTKRHLSRSGADPNMINLALDEIEDALSATERPEPQPEEPFDFEAIGQAFDQFTKFINGFREGLRKMSEDLMGDDKP